MCCAHTHTRGGSVRFLFETAVRVPDGTWPHPPPTAPRRATIKPCSASTSVETSMCVCVIMVMIYYYYYVVIVIRITRRCRRRHRCRLFPRCSKRTALIKSRPSLRGFERRWSSSGSFATTPRRAHPPPPPPTLTNSSRGRTGDGQGWLRSRRARKSRTVLVGSTAAFGGTTASAPADSYAVAYYTRSQPGSNRARKINLTVSGKKTRHFRAFWPVRLMRAKFFLS